MVMERRELGAAIRAARMENRLTQEKLAELIGVAPSHVKQIESGNRSPSVEVLYKFAVTLNFSVDDVFFQRKQDDYALLRRIERCLQKCDAHELKVMYATVTALLEKHDQE